MSPLVPTDYATTLDLIKGRVRSAQYEALKAVNKKLIALYWDIGKIIVERQAGDTWGRSVVGNEFLAPLVREIGWSHDIVLLEKCKDAHERHRPATWEADRRSPCGGPRRAETSSSRRPYSGTGRIQPG